jgi:chorismate mutase
METKNAQDLKVLVRWVKMVTKAKAETGLLMGTEVATAAHCKLALEHDIDVLWVGYYCKSVCCAGNCRYIAGRDKIVLIKPVNPQIWLYMVV